MDLRNFDLNLLIVFEMLCIEQSTTRAAEKLAMTQPAVSKSLSRLRTLFDDPLFTRVPTGLIPTRRTEELYPVLRNALNGIREGLRQPDRFQYREASVKYHLAATDFFNAAMTHRIVDVLAHTAAHAKLNIQSIPNQLAGLKFHNLPVALNEALQEGSLDLLIHHDITIGEKLRYQKLLEDDWVVVANSHFEGLIEDEPERFLACSKGHVSMGFRRWDEQLLDMADGLETAHEVQTVQQVLSIIEHTDYTGLVPRRMLTGQSHQIKAMPLRGLLPPLELFQFWHEKAQEHTPNQWLRRLIFSYCKRS